MSEYEDAYEDAIAPSTSQNWDAPVFDRSKLKNRTCRHVNIGLLGISGHIAGDILSIETKYWIEDGPHNEEIYCWHCHKSLNADEFYYCFDCLEECWAYWGA